MSTRRMAFALGAAVGAAAALTLLRSKTAPLKPAASATTAITGASSGIGAAFARQLAALGYDLVLIARRVDRLEALAAELQRSCGIQVEVLPADLTHEADLRRVEAQLAVLSDLELLVNNAGVGVEGRFHQADPGPQLAMIELHVLASVRLARAVLPEMVARGRGGIINVASVAGFMALPGNATYCATKGYLITFSKALALELRGTGVRVQALCPGFTHTEFHEDLREFDKRKTPAFLWMPAEAVVDASLRSFAHGDVVCIPGSGNRLLAMLGGSPLASIAAPLFLR